MGTFLGAAWTREGRKPFLPTWHVHKSAYTDLLTHIHTTHTTCTHTQPSPLGSRNMSHSDATLLLSCPLCQQPCSSFLQQPWPPPPPGESESMGWFRPHRVGLP